MVHIELAKLPQGRLLIGKYMGRAAAVKKIAGAGGELIEQELPGLWRLAVETTKRGAVIPQEVSYSDTDRDGELSRFHERVILEGGLPPVGSLVAISFASKGSIQRGTQNVYSNDTATDMVVLGLPGEWEGDEG